MPRDAPLSIDPDDLLKAYTLGYFPMARQRFDEQVVWVLPDIRGVLRLRDFHAPKSLVKTLKREPFRVTANEAFAQVIAECARSAKGREETWINHAIEEVYVALHAAGRAHSVECWDGDRLVGGLYGVGIGGAFCGESMFSRARDASKVALAHLVARLKIAGFDLLDTQFWTPHLARFGVKECPNADYQAMLATALKRPASFSDAPRYLSTLTVLQSITQTS